MPVCVVNNDATCGARVCFLSKDLPAWTVAQTKLIKIWPRRFGLRVPRREVRVGKTKKEAKAKVKGQRPSDDDDDDDGGAMSK